MKVSEYIAKFIEAKKIDCVFELSGGMITNLLDAIHLSTRINIVTMHHEQSAAFAADAYGRVTGKPGVALATSGPGATNLITGIGSCFFDSVPSIFITGQVNRHELKGSKPIRQQGFQETDIVSTVRTLTKKCYQLECASDIPAILNEAFTIATHGRPGPVLIDIPMDLQRAVIDANPLADAAVSPAHPQEENSLVGLCHDLSSQIKTAKKPLLLVGRGVRAGFATDAMEAFLSLTHIPIVTSLLALDAVPHNHPQRAGFIGSYGNRWANTAVGECDLLIVAGSRLDIRQTGADVNFFKQRRIFHIDCEDSEINNRITGCTPIVADTKHFFELFLRSHEKDVYPTGTEWITHIDRLRKKWPDTDELQCNGINPNQFIHLLSRGSRQSQAYIADVGSHQMWTAQSLEIASGQLFLTSGGMGAMGYALPAAIGASHALGRGPVVAIIGDGSMQINIQELQTIVRNNLPIKIIILNNQNLGMIRQFQDSYFESRYQSTWWGYSAPDFEKIAKAYGIDARTISETEHVDEAISWLWNSENLNKPVLLQVMIDSHANTYPKIAFGKPITEMEPFSAPIDMEGT